MDYAAIPFPGGTALRFKTDRGTVWALVRPKGRGVAGVEIYEQGAGLASRGLTDAEARVAPEFVAARNRFGTGLMLRVCRAIKAEFPWASRWTYERVSGAHPGAERERV